MEWNLKNHAVNLEEQFFANQEAELIERMREKNKTQKTIEALEQASGIKDKDVLAELEKLGLDPSTLAALSLVPLIEVAWADLELDKRERKAILKVVSEKRIGADSPSYNLLESWLTEKPAPEVRKAWKDYVQALCKNMDAPNRSALKNEILGQARYVADASGGLLGVIDKVSTAEELVLEDLGTAFD